MASPYTFAYTPSATARLFTINSVLCAIDVVQLTPTEVKFGVLERFANGTAQWMGINSNTSGIPVWMIKTAKSPLGPTTQPNPLHDTPEPSQGLILDDVNGMGTKLLTDLKGVLNARLAARFPASGPTPPVTSPPFANETSAIAWLVSQVNVVIPAPVNCVIS